MIGETISHYRILERLGAGGMGEVYKAEDLRLHRPVALKLLLANGAESETARKRFLREAQAASALNHPNIATIYEIDEVERNGERYSFIVMEYVPGRTLREMAGEFPVVEAVEIVMQIADALAAAHERGIVHRDIKPSNVIITEQQRVKVLDFGVAKYTPTPLESGDTASLYATEALKTNPGSVIGTFAYMSPEQALGKDVDHRSDVFSLGVLAYELLAGSPPFTGSSTLAVVDAIIHAEPPPLARFNIQAPPALEAIILLMLEKPREVRYQNLHEVHADLENVRRELGTQLLNAQNYETNVGYATQLMPTPSGNIVARSGMQRTGKSIAVLRFSNITRQPEDDWLGVGIAETVTADLKNIGGVTVIGRELVYEVLRRWNAENQADFDEQFATRVGREIGARWIIVGGYQRLGEMLRITARFVAVENGEVIKTVKIDGQMSEIFELQDKIIYELSHDLELTLRSAERADIDQRDTNVIGAYEAFTKGMILVFAGSRASLDEAVQLFEQAIALDPRYAQAYAGRGYALGLKAEFLTEPELLDEAVENFQKAIELRPQLHDAYSGLGMTFLAQDRVDDAIGALKRALAFAPNDARAHAALGRAYFLGKGMFRAAAAEYERALAAESDNEWAAPALAHCYIYLGDYARAEELARQGITQQEQYVKGHEGMQIIGAYTKLGQIYYLQGRYDDAIAEYYREIVFARQSDHALKDRVLIEAYQKLACAYIRQGDLENAREAFSEMQERFTERLQRGADDPFTRYYVACACAVLGEQEAALESLEKALQGRRQFNLTRARTEGDFESLRDDQRFIALLGDTQ